MRSLLLAALVLAPLPLRADTTLTDIKAPSAEGLGGETSVSPDLGRVVADRLKFGGFDCGAWDPVKGLACFGKFRKEIYPQEVGVFIPPSYTVKDRADMIVHLHGYPWASGNGVASLRALHAYFKYDKLLADSGRDSILVVPYGGDGDTVYNDRLMSPTQFSAFMEAVGILLRDAGLTTYSDAASLSLCGHSGADHALSGIVPSAANLKELLLFESIYEGADAFAAFAGQSGARFMSAYVVGHRTEDGNFSVWQQLRPSGKSKQKNAFDADVLAPNAPNLSSITTGFLRSDQDHRDTFTKYFPLFLKR